MKIIEGLKKIKELQKKAEDLRALARTHCAIGSIETPTYGSEKDQMEKVESWIQSHRDILKEILKLRAAIQRTNLQTTVSIELAGKAVSKTVAEWIHRRRDLAGLELEMWKGLTDRGIKEGYGQGPSGMQLEIKVKRFYNPSIRDQMKEELTAEPLVIDARLEVVNAITDLVE